jgi:hypothetical protein
LFRIVGEGVAYEVISVVSNGSAVTWKVVDLDRIRYFAAHGVGFQPAAFGSFLKSVVVMYGRVK